MKYQGSKRLISKEILSIILKNRKPGQYYVEPFVGGANTIDKVEGLRIGSDINPYLIELLKALQNGWTPAINYTESEYNEIKNNKDFYPLELVGYFGFQLSYGSKFFAGWCRDNQGSRNHRFEAYQNVVKQAPNLKGIDLYCCDYMDLEIPLKSIIYCDPPYRGTTKYKTKNFDHNEFYGWCYAKALEGHNIFISEYDMPKEFDCIWQKQVSSSLTKDTGSRKAVEKLYTIL